MSQEKNLGSIIERISKTKVQRPKTLFSYDSQQLDKTEGAVSSYV
jgi:hypothetical protein